MCMGYDDDGVAEAPVYLVIGHGGAGLNFNIEVPAAPYWQVSSFLLAGCSFPPAGQQLLLAKCTSVAASS
jgi:hypothetical protein